MNPRLRILIVVILGSFLGIAAWRWTDDPQPGSPPPSPQGTETATSPTGPPGSDVPGTTTSSPETVSERVAYVVTRNGTALTIDGQDTAVPVADGVLFPVLEEAEGRYRVFDTCNRPGWVETGDVDAGTVPEGPPDDFGQAVFVIDPGHGIPDYGASGPSGLTETEVNLEVAARLVELLRSPRDVNWTTGAVSDGDDIPAAATAVLTRSPDGPAQGQYELGLEFRTTVANALDATALVSIHHNSSPETNLDHPGSEAFVSLDNPESPRLGGLIVEELRSSLSRFEADWTGSSGSGLISRVNPEGGDYYSVLARSEVPAVIVEGAYISNPSEEALARTEEFQMAYAEGVYRALVRFVTTDDYPIPAPEPQIWDPERPGPSVHDCRVPTP